jgi:DNA-binding response OmpR family regulator
MPMSKMLIVDDEREICDFLKEFFSDREFDVSTASSGEEALHKIASENPKILLLDVTMPGIDGIDVLREVKERYPYIKVIMVTAVETPDKMEEALRLGADNYITKPLSLEYLEKDVREKIAKL